MPRRFGQLRIPERRSLDDSLWSMGLAIWSTGLAMARLLIKSADGCCDCWVRHSESCAAWPLEELCDAFESRTSFLDARERLATILDVRDVRTLDLRPSRVGLREMGGSASASPSKTMLTRRHAPPLSGTAIVE